MSVLLAELPELTELAVDRVGAVLVTDRIIQEQIFQTATAQLILGRAQVAEVLLKVKPSVSGLSGFLLSRVVPRAVQGTGDANVQHATT